MVAIVRCGQCARVRDVIVGGSVRRWVLLPSRRPPVMCRVWRARGQLLGGGGEVARAVARWVEGPEERGRCSVSRRGRWDSERRRSEIAIDSETNCRSSFRRCEHLDSAARQFTLSTTLISLHNPCNPSRLHAYAKLACGATNTSSRPFIRPSIRAVKLLLPLCTSALMSSRRTSSASPFRRTCAFMEGQMARTKASKLAPAKSGEA